MNRLNAAAARALIELGNGLISNGYRFTTATPATHARVNCRIGNQDARSVEDVFGWSRSFDASLLPYGWLDLLREAGQLAREAGRWKSTVRASTLGSRLYFHSSYPTLNADAVFFGPDTYRFVGALSTRLAARRYPVTRALDLCSGAGAGAIEIAARFPEAAVIGGDINPNALQVAAVNAALAGTENVVLVQSDLLTGIDGEFDLIVANPPYLLDPMERAYRHGGGHSGEALSLSIIENGLERLATGGSLVLYTGSTITNGHDRLLSEAKTRLENTDIEWSYCEIDPDVFGEELVEAAYRHADRIAAVVLTVTRNR